MAEFNPPVPEAQEPNYLRYSRPQNFAEPNKAVGEAFKGAGEVLSQGMKDADSLLKGGITSDVQAHAGAEEKAEIGRREVWHNALYGTNFNTTGRPVEKDSSTLGYADEGQQPTTPRDIKMLPQRVDAMISAKAVGGQVNAQYEANQQGYIRDLRQRFPAFRGFIDQTYAKATGGIEANKYASTLLKNIDAAYAKIDSDKKEDENFAKEGVNKGLVDNVLYEQVRNQVPGAAGKARQLIYAAAVQDNRFKQAEHSLILSKGNLELSEKQDAENKRIAQNAVNADASSELNRTLQTLNAAHGLYNDQDFNRRMEAYHAGKGPMPSEEEQQRRAEYHQTIGAGLAQKLIQRWTSNPDGVSKHMSPADMQKNANEVVENFRTIAGWNDNKRYVSSAFLATGHIDALENDTKHRLALSPAGGWLMMAKALHGASDEWSKSVTDNAINNSLGKEEKALMMDSALKAMTYGFPGLPDGSKPPPAVLPDLDKMHSLGMSGDAKQATLQSIDHMSDPKTPVPVIKNLVNYAFKDPALLNAIERDSIGPDGKVKPGRLSVWDSLTSQPKIDASHALGGQYWQTHKDWTTDSYRTIFNDSLRDMTNLDGRYKVSWDSDNNKVKIDKTGRPDSSAAKRLKGTLGEGVQELSELSSRISRTIDEFDPFGFKKHTFGPLGPAPTYTQPHKVIENSVNRAIEGLRRVASKDQGVDVNALVLENLEAASPELKDSPLHKQMWDAIIASHTAPGVPNLPSTKDKP